MALLGWPERAAVLLLVAWVVWAVIAAASVGRVLSPVSPYVVAPLALVAGALLGQRAAPYAAHRAMALTLLAIASYLLLTSLWTPGAGKGPLGYANANAALAVQVIGLCGLVMVRTSGRLRAAVGLGSVLALAAVAANASRAGLAVALPLLVVVGIMAWRPARSRWSAVVVAAVGLITVTAAAMTVTVLAHRAIWPAWAVRAFDPTRQTMWRDALALWERHPVLGAGPGTFERVSTLGGDPDTAAAHSSALQIGAETGWVGVALFAAVVIAGLAWACRGTPEDAVIATAAWTALLVHSFADHLLDFGPVVLAAGLVLGWAGSRPNRSEELDVAEGEGPVLR